MFKIYDQKEPTYDEARKFIGGYIQSVPLETVTACYAMRKEN